MENLQRVTTSVVPWFNKKEWLLVYNLIYKDPITSDRRKQALEIIKMWKVRSPSLPAGVEGTFIILQALEKSSKDLEVYDYQIIYSNAILRFLNVCAAYDTKQGTFSRTAQTVNIPKWMVDVRHDIAHCSILPSLDMLKKACDFSIKWLYDQYWHPLLDTLQDYTLEMSQNETKSDNENMENLQFIINVLECIVIFQYPKFNLKIINDIPNNESKNCLLKDLKTYALFSDITKNTYLSVINKSLVAYLSTYLVDKSFSVKQLVIDILLNGDTFICEPDLQLQIFETNDLENLPWDFVSLWNDFLCTLHKLSMLDILLTKLFAIVTNDKEKKYRRKFAALWIAEIVKGLKKIKLARDIIKSKQQEDDVSRKRKNWQTYAIAKVEENHLEFKSVLTFDFLSTIPATVEDLRKFQKIALDEPDEYTLIFLPFVLEIINPPLSDELVLRLVTLVENYIQPEKIKQTYTNELDLIFSIKDLEITSDSQSCKQTDSVSENLTIQNNSIKKGVINEDHQSNNLWKLAPDHISFKNIPLGLLPWQDRNENPLLKNYLKNC